MGHVVMENRSGLVVVATTTLATGTAQREAAEAMIGELSGGHRITLGADKAYDTADFRRRDAVAKCDPACDAEQQAPPLRNRRPHHPP
jgi:hypothetical protein